MEHVTDTAQEKAQQVAHQVREQADNVASEWRVQMTERSIAMRDKGVTRLRSLATELRQMAAVPTGSSSTAHDAARLAADRIDTLCSELERRDPGEMIVEARAYARRHPTQVIIGMFATGALVGRMMHGVSSQRSSSSQPSIDLRDRSDLPGSGIPDAGYIR